MGVLVNVTADFIVNIIAWSIIMVAWSITKVRMGAEWTRLTYSVGVDMARGTRADEGD